MRSCDPHGTRSLLSFPRDNEGKHSGQQSVMDAELRRGTHMQPVSCCPHMLQGFNEVKGKMHMQ